ncbi:MAG: ubiquinone-dependent pyruvate dehydrogenase [Thermoplasmata archaeon]|nr:ubiquinone-dependent pyruvate dehydrogenase [Thermoplasmata archaeon]
MGTSAAEWLVQTLADLGVERVYGVAGDSLNGITDAIRRRGQPRWVHVRHEEVAAFAAGAESQLHGGLGVCAGSCGPGNLHLINGLYDAHRTRTPVLAIAAQIPSAEIGSDYFQETHPERLFRECSRFAEYVGAPDQLPRILETAVRTALAERDVSVIVLPGDIALGTLTDPRASAPLTSGGGLAVPSEADLARLVAVLDPARRVTILAGRGCAGAHDDLVAFADRIQAPVVHALGGKEWVEFDNPFDIGMTGLLGFSAGFKAMRECEVLVMLGTDFPYRQFYPESATVVQLDRRGEQIGRRTRVDLGLVGDVGATLRALQPRLARHSDSDHLHASLADYASSRAGIDDLAVGPTGVRPLHPQFVAKVLDELASDDAIFSCDVGTPTIWAARYLRMNGRRRLLGSFNHGSMANALPQAIGAKAAYPARQVVSLSGDGGLAMLLGDLLTLAQEKLAVKVVVFNNSALGFVYMEQLSDGLLPFGTALVNPDFAALAATAGILGQRVELPEQVRPALEKAFAHDGPALIEVIVSRQELVVPPSIHAAQVKGIGLFLLKAVLSGRGDEVVDLAKTNLLRTGFLGRHLAPDRPS